MNIIDYLKKYKDVTLEELEFNEVDSLILNAIAPINNCSYKSINNAIWFDKNNSITVKPNKEFVIHFIIDGFDSIVIRYSLVQQINVSVYIFEVCHISDRCKCHVRIEAALKRERVVVQVRRCF